MKKQIFTVFLLILFLWCGKDEGIKNNPPEIIGGIDIYINGELISPEDKIEAGAEVELRIKAEDKDKDAMTFDWKGDGTFPDKRNSTTINWIAPSLPGTYSIYAYAYDGKGGVDSTSRIVDVVLYARMSVSPDTLDFSSDLDSLNIIISNSGKIKLDWTAKYQASWISLSNIGGSVEPDDSSIITVVVSRLDLDNGRYLDSIIIDAGSYGRKKITVIMLVEAVIHLVPDSLYFELWEDKKQVIIWNIGVGNLYFKAKPEEKWIKIEPDTGKIKSQDYQVVMVTIDKKNLSPGTHKPEVIFDCSPAKAGTLLVVVNIPEPGYLNVEPQLIDMGAEEELEYFWITNTGVARIYWSITPQVNWITVDPDEGFTEKERDVVEVRVDRSLLAKPGYHRGRIVVDAGNAGRTEVEVKVEKTTHPPGDVMHETFPDGVPVEDWQIKSADVMYDSGYACIKPKSRNREGAIVLDKIYAASKFKFTFDIAVSDMDMLGNGWTGLALELNNGSYELIYSGGLLAYRFVRFALAINRYGEATILGYNDYTQFGNPEGWYFLVRTDEGNTWFELYDFSFEPYDWHTLDFLCKDGLLSIYFNDEYIAGFRPYSRRCPNFDQIWLINFASRLTCEVCFDNIDLYSSFNFNVNSDKEPLINLNMNKTDFFEMLRLDK